VGESLQNSGGGKIDELPWEPRQKEHVPAPCRAGQKVSRTHYRVLLENASPKTRVMGRGGYESLTNQQKNFSSRARERDKNPQLKGGKVVTPLRGFTRKCECR